MSRLLAAALLSTGLGSAQSLSLHNVTVVDANGARAGQTVRIENGRIASVGKSGPRSPGDRDGTGKFLIPGLWDMHVHLRSEPGAPGRYIASGVLGLRDMGSDLAGVRRLEAQSHLKPRIYASGPAVDGPDSPAGPPGVLHVSGPEEAREVASRLEKQAADFVSIRAGLSRDSYLALAQRARVIRIPFAGIIPGTITADEAIDARQKSIEHLFGIPLACTPLAASLRGQRGPETLRRIYDTFNPTLATELFRRMARFDVYVTPTLTMWQRMERDREIDRSTYEFHARLVRLAEDAGTGLLAGSDAGLTGVEPGKALHDELQALVEAGLTPQQALTAATLQPARYFDIEASHGTIAKGKAADLVLLDGNPLADIGNTRRIAAVILGGQYLNRACLDSLANGRTQACPSASLKTTPKTAPRDRSSAKPRASSRKPVSRTR